MPSVNLPVTQSGVTLGDAHSFWSGTNGNPVDGTTASFTPGGGSSSVTVDVVIDESVIPIGAVVTGGVVHLNLSSSGGLTPGDMFGVAIQPFPPVYSGDYDVDIFTALGGNLPGPTSNFDFFGLITPGSVTINSLVFEVTYTLVVAVMVISVDPVFGTSLGSTDVTITGTGFQSGAGVTFDGLPATDVIVVNDTTITCKTPAHALGVVSVVVSNSTDGSFGVGTDLYEYSDGIDSCTPNTGTMAGGDLVTLVGRGFVEGSSINFGGLPATEVTFVDATTYTCRTPARTLGTVDIEIVGP